MSKYPELILGALLGATVALPVSADGYGLGRAALPEEIAAWDKDVSPDGTGLPPGSGSVEDGEMLFSEHCAACHGDFAEGIDNWPKLAGGFDTLDRQDPVKTVGSYWPYLSTTWDYINRSMPFGNAQSMSVDEVYALTAYILYSNDLVDDDFVLSDENLPRVEMPNVGGFFLDDRDTVEYPLFTSEPCMTDCKENVAVTMRAMVLDVTPEIKTPDSEAEAEPEQEADVEPVGPDPELVAEGEKVFRKCKSCHQVGEGAKNRTGPHLNGVMGRAIGTVDGFRYSRAFNELADAGAVWDPDRMAAYLADPRGTVKGTKMSFRGLDDAGDVDAITAYLSTFPSE